MSNPHTRIVVHQTKELFSSNQRTTAWASLFLSYLMKCHCRWCNSFCAPHIPLYRPLDIGGDDGFGWGSATADRCVCFSCVVFAIIKAIFVTVVSRRGYSSEALPLLAVHVVCLLICSRTYKEELHPLVFAFKNMPASSANGISGWLIFRLRFEEENNIARMLGKFVFQTKVVNFPTFFKFVITDVVPQTGIEW